jgi:DNA topoisomerase I
VRDSPSPTVEARAAARGAGLRYVSDDGPGFRRTGRPGKFSYLDQHGKKIRHAATLERVKQLGIPPAWTAVWISPGEDGHIQATGRDARGRKQYRYHAGWRETRDETKFERMIFFGQALPRIRQRVARDLRNDGLGRSKVIAAMIRLLEATHIRVGNEEYARENRSFGLSTLRDRHVEIRGGTMRFNFLGKSGKTHDIELHDARLAKIVRSAQELPGQELFQYLDENGVRQKVSSEDVNAYLREVAGEEFSAKDFRTWAGTVFAALALCDLMTAAEATPTKKNLRTAIEQVAERLGNTPAICRKSYIHPVVMESYLAGETVKVDGARLKNVASRSPHLLGPEEKAVLVFLKSKLARPRRPLTELLKRSLHPKAKRRR